MGEAESVFRSGIATGVGADVTIAAGVETSCGVFRGSGSSIASGVEKLERLGGLLGLAGDLRVLVNASWAA